MKTVHTTVGGIERPIYVAQDTEDAKELVHKVQAIEPQPLAVDVETTGFDIFAQDWHIRLAQFGTMEFSVVFPLEAKVGRVAVKKLLRHYSGSLLAHNAKFDILSLDRENLCPLELLWSKTTDTRLLAHLIDPRGKADGGPGLALKDLSVEHFDDTAKDSQKELKLFFQDLARLFKRKTEDKNADPERMALVRELKKRMETFKAGDGWRHIDLFDPVYLEYAGLDTILTAWLYDCLIPIIRSRKFTRLQEFEHNVARACSKIERTGMPVDVGYAAGPLRQLLTEHEELHSNRAFELGVENVNSTAEVGERLIEMGAVLLDTTPTGKPKVDKDALETIVDTNTGKVKELAESVLGAKRAHKQRVTYVDGVLDNMGADGRCHASIASLQARTARMSVSNPPLQQIPSDDWTIRRVFGLPESGNAIIAADFSQIELRVLAALAREHTMLEAFDKGQDLHQMTADAAGVERRVGKMCLTPEHRVLTPEMTWVALDTLSVGDGLMGFDENPRAPYAPKGGMRRWLNARVTGLTRAKEETLKVTLADGSSITGTTDHRIIVRQADSQLQWSALEDLQVGQRLAKGFDTWEVSASPEDAYFYRALDGARMPTAAVEIVAIEPTGVREVVVMETDTSTFVAEGYLHHNCNFLVVYGGGAGKLAKNAGIDLRTAKHVRNSFKRTYPGVGRFNRNIQDRYLAGRKSVVTPTGRRLPLDRQRVYAGLNYMIQSTARDVMAQALLDIEEAGLLPYVVMTVHDEIIGETAEHEAQSIVDEVAQIMYVDNFLGKGIDIPADGAVYGKSWGHGYVKKGQRIPKWAA